MACAIFPTFIHEQRIFCLVPISALAISCSKNLEGGQREALTAAGNLRFAHFDLFGCFAMVQWPPSPEYLRPTVRFSHIEVLSGGHVSRGCSAVSTTSVQRCQFLLLMGNPLFQVLLRQTPAEDVTEWPEFVLFCLVLFFCVRKALHPRCFWNLSRACPTCSWSIATPRMAF